MQLSGLTYILGFKYFGSQSLNFCLIYILGNCRLVFFAFHTSFLGNLVLLFLKNIGYYVKM